MKHLDYHAKIIIYDLPKLTRKNRARLVEWMRMTAMEIKREDPKVFASRYIARLMK